MINNLANRLKSLREEYGYLQKDMAEKLDMSTSGYGFYETGRRNPDAIMIEKLCDIFDVDADFLLARTNTRKTSKDLVLNSAYHSVSTDGLDEQDIKMIKSMVDRLRKSHNTN